MLASCLCHRTYLSSFKPVDVLAYTNMDTPQQDLYSFVAVLLNVDHHEATGCNEKKKTPQKTVKHKNAAKIKLSVLRFTWCRSY